MNNSVLLIGAGGHAKVLINCLSLCRVKVLGIIDYNIDNLDQMILGIPIIGCDESVLRYNPTEVKLVNGIGSVQSLTLRRNIYLKFKSHGFSFLTVTHPSAIIASDAIIDEGVQVMAGAIIQPGCRIGYNSIINTKVSVDHDCVIGNHVHLAPGVTLSGSVEVGAESHIGTGSTVVQGVTIGASSIVAAGSVVIRDIPSDAMVMGVPGKVVKA